MAAYVELTLDQGTTFNSVITIADDITNANVNISGLIVTSQMRRSYYSVNPTANFTCAISNTVVGQITLSLTAEQTANIKAGRYLFDVNLDATAQNTVIRLLEGIITVTPGITK
jgi:hypothetical protein